MEYNHLLKFFVEQQGIFGALGVAALWAVREFYTARKKKDEQVDSKIEHLDKTLQETKIEIVKLNSNFENLNKRLDEKFAQIESNKKSLDSAHEKIRGLQEANAKVQ